MNNREGQRIDNYRLIRLLGAGQFGEVYLAMPVDSHNDVPVAIKILLPLARDDQRDLLHFLKEVRASRLTHPHIVQVYDFGVEGHIPFIVMEYAPNGTLRRRHPYGTPVPLPTIVSYVQQVASALQYIHEKRFVHRDIKPANMLIGAQNQILLSDFGIVTTSHSTSSQGQEEMAGTVPYISPEQINGRPRSASDQYSLGVVVYEWLSGHCPFQGSIAEVMYRHQTLPPPSLTAQIPTLPPEVEQVVMRALAKDPKQRFDHIMEFAQALEQAIPPVPRQNTVPALSPILFLDSTLGPDSSLFSDGTLGPDSSLSPNSTSVQGSMRKSTKPWISRRTVVLGCVGAGSVLATGSLVWFLQHMQGLLPALISVPTPTPHPTPSPIPTPIPPGTVLSVYHGHSRWVNAAAWSPGGMLIASGSDDTTVQIWHALDAHHVLNYNGHTDLVEAVAWSPDGRRIASGSFDSTVQVWNATNGGHVFTYKGHSDHVDTLVWSPDGNRIASGSYDQTIQVWKATDGSHVLTYNRHTDAIRMVAWSPDSNLIASAGFDGTVQVWNATNGSPVFTYKGHTGIVQAVAWSPNSQLIASGGNDQTVQIWVPTDGNRVLTYNGHSDVVNTIAWSPDGQLIASGGVDTTVQIWDTLNGNHLLTYQKHSLEVRVAAWSPDGRLIASGGDDDLVQVWGTGR